MHGLGQTEEDTVRIIGRDHHASPHRIQRLKSWGSGVDRPQHYGKDGLIAWQSYKLSEEE